MQTTEKIEEDHSLMGSAQSRTTYLWTFWFYQSSGWFMFIRDVWVVLGGSVRLTCALWRRTAHTFICPGARLRLWRAARFLVSSRLKRAPAYVTTHKRQILASVSHWNRPEQEVLWSPTAHWRSCWPADISPARGRKDLKTHLMETSLLWEKWTTATVYPHEDSSSLQSWNKELHKMAK